jgi:hypothetical protein
MILVAGALGPILVPFSAYATIRIFMMIFEQETEFLARIIAVWFVFYLESRLYFSSNASGWFMDFSHSRSSSFTPVSTASAALSLNLPYD